MLQYVLAAMGITFAFLFLLTGIRALVFAHRQKEKFVNRGIVEKSAWWFRLFQKDGFGPDAEFERRRLRIALLVFGGLFFATGGLVNLLAISAN